MGSTYQWCPEVAYEVIDDRLTISTLLASCIYFTSDVLLQSVTCLCCGLLVSVVDLSGYSHRWRKTSTAAASWLTWTWTPAARSTKRSETLSWRSTTSSWVSCVSLSLPPPRSCLRPPPPPPCLSKHWFFFFFHHLFARLPRWKKWWERRRRRATPSTCALGTTRYTASGAWRNASRGWRSWRTPGVATRRRSSESHSSFHRSVSSKRAVKHQITVPEIVFFTFITTSPVGCQFIITSLSLMVTALFTVVSLSMSNNRYCFTLMGNHCLIALVSLVFFWEFYLGFNK